MNKLIFYNNHIYCNQIIIPNKRIYLRIFNMINDLPLFKYKNIIIDIIYLSGDHYFKKVKLQDISKLTDYDFDRIKHISFGDKYNNFINSFEIDQFYIISQISTDISLRLLYKLIKRINQFHYNICNKIIQFKLQIYSTDPIDILINIITPYLKRLYIINQYILNEHLKLSNTIYFPDVSKLNIFDFNSLQKNHNIIVEFKEYNQHHTILFKSIQKNINGIFITSDNYNWIISFLSFLKLYNLI